MKLNPMIGAAYLLCFLPLQVIGLITTNAKCLSGYEWMFSSIGQSPCDAAAELASVCIGGQFNLDPLDPGYVYAGPTQANQNTCRCSSVYYSLLSACGFCQGRNYVTWSMYRFNCSTVYVATYNQQIPVGVKVPAYAYQNVSISNRFDVTLAQTMRGVESSRTPSTSTESSAVTNTSDSSKNTNTPAIVGGVIGGIAGLGVLVLALWLLLRKQKLKPQTYNQSFPLNPTTAFISNSTPSLTSPPGSPGSSEERNDFSKYSPSMTHPYRQHSPPFRIQSMPPGDKGNISELEL